ncbi:MAG: 16S rRNA (cytidine(1402)-2'-O)-methyltransferase [Devosiaceae bacterium]|nr:16S rRNA (cytidine(1402)-2'-O)-methyltransferase [Devosiaceae bacterium]
MREQKQGQFCIFGTQFFAPSLAPGLYVVATPIGNLKDITIRALQILAGADQVLCEDTRQSARLLDHYLIKTPKLALHEHNERARTPALVKKLQNGATLALISDAGTPLLSDPGFPLVRAAREAGVDVFALPGPSALLAALATAGLPTDRFTFIGFLPVKKMARLAALQEIATRSETLVFYESARRLRVVIDAMITVFGSERRAAISLELTKKFERTLTGSLDELARQLNEMPPRGEVVISVAGTPHSAPDENIWLADLKSALQTQPLRSAVAEVTTTHGLRRKQVYEAALKLKS